ncbi:2000_t:CDS:1, partial [Gigaspora margarita]
EMLRVNAFGQWSLHLHIVMSLKDLSELVNPSHPVFDIEQFPKHTKVTQGLFEDYQRSYGNKYAFIYINGIPRGKFYIVFLLPFIIIKHEISLSEVAVYIWDDCN